MKPKIEDVAKLAGVSPTTVSRVLNNRGYISQKTKDNVQKAMNELNYFPNDLARSLFNKRTYLIGLILPTTSNPFFGELTFHIENICASLGYKVLLCNSLNRIDKEEQYAEMLMRNQVDGIIVGTHNQGTFHYHKQNLPIVAIDRYFSNTIPVVGSDNYAGGKLATEHLLSKGCKKIIHFNAPLQIEAPGQLRRTAFEDVLKKHHMEPVTYEIETPLGHEGQKEVIQKAFGEIPDVDGVFASNDLIAAVVINEAKKRGIDIPNRLKVVGYDGTETGKIMMPQLTTIQQPIDLIAKTAIEILRKEIDGEFGTAPYETQLPVTLLEGKTT
ncbi:MULTISPECIES: LacI family DNA-binding transcriptional regulator [Bacillus]|uniref:LacI family transcriptional regulator n=2 Tax=Bacillus TaxID=1386 RepID=A0A0M5JAU5_9BACI|nr:MULTISPECIES: LacI family DNA-binding transcriptional regulator [Bacillus]ALC83551.1 LacI family transcriptional regulator [Bacillus gobiensis]MBP1082534.1 LacI family sucrose operon transcriptional repressor [Bacillus capparidis]MED1097233.1 LacI family DNA-binding transcriptional regulator [Bacillus capparidis]